MKINQSKISSENILVAPLNWGLGHATRCIPIIKELLKQGFNPIIASDGNALILLQKEFPKLKAIELPSYNIKYPKSGEFLKWKLLSRIPRTITSVKREKELIEELVISENLVGIISDNRIGVRSSKVPSVYITHQLNVLAGRMTFFTSHIHQFYINKFDECWIPDGSNENSLSGVLSDSRRIHNSKFIGVLSRLEKIKVEKKYDLLVLLSGIEPLRTQLENKLQEELKGYYGRVLFVRGTMDPNVMPSNDVKNITYCNFLLSNELEKTINESELILARSGYSTIMDLAKLNKKAFFIPTTGQEEQEYLAKHLKALKIAPFSSIKSFKIKMLEELIEYTGFTKNYSSELPEDLFHLFHGK